MKTILLLLPTTLLMMVQATKLKPTICSLRTSNFANDNPLVLKSVRWHEDRYDVYNPDMGDTLLFKSGQRVWFACPGTGFKNSKTKLLYAECVGDTYFKQVNSTHKKQPFESLKCNGIPKSVLKPTGVCAGDKSAFAVGFEVGGKFVNVIDVLCFDRVTDSVVYVKYTVSHNIDGSQKNFKRPHYKADVLFHNVSLDAAYNWRHQQLQFRQYVLWPFPVSNYVNEKEHVWRAQLAPPADFVYGAQQTATFYYANTAPQWQTVNVGNWIELEAAVRALAVKTGNDLTVYTGAHGHYKIRGYDVYMTEDMNGNPVMPVPMLFWKVVVDERNGLAAAFVVLNDPYGYTTDNDALSACAPHSLCSRVKWVSFDPTPSSGLAYCCTVDVLRNAVPTIPSIPRYDTIKLLTG